MEIILIVLVFYFIPTIIAISRKHKSMAAIIVVNVLFGWSLIGWLWAFIWSLASAHNAPVNVTIIHRQ